MARPKPCAAPVTTATFPAKLESIDDLTGLLDRDAPERQHLLVWLLVGAAIVAVPDQVADRCRREPAQPVEVGHRLMARRGRSDAVPGEVFHPRAVRGLRIDLL